MSVKVEMKPQVVDSSAPKVKTSPKTSTIVVAKTLADKPVTAAVAVQSSVASTVEKTRIKRLHKNFNASAIADKIIAGLIDKLNAGQGASILNGSIGTGSGSKFFASPKFMSALESAYNRQRQDALMAVKNLPFKSLYRNMDIIRKIFGSAFISNEYLLTKAIQENESADFVNKMIEKYTGKSVTKLRLSATDRSLSYTAGISLGAISEKIDKIEFEEKKKEKNAEKKEKLFGTNVISSDIKEKYGLKGDEVPESLPNNDDKKIKTFGLHVVNQDSSDKDEKALDKMDAIMTKRKNNGVSTNPFS